MDTTNIERYIYVGWRDKNWYKETEELFTAIYGKDNLKLVCNLFAATSMNSSLKSNIRLFRRALYERQNNLPHEKYLPGIRDQLNRLREGKELSGQKIRAFSAAMSGDAEAVVVDIWLLRAFGLDRKYYRKGSESFRSGGATEKQFNDITKWVREKAAQLNLEPRELSAIIWSGIRLELSNEKETRYHEILKHQLYNMYDKTN